MFGIVIPESLFMKYIAEVAQLVEHDLAPKGKNQTDLGKVFGIVIPESLFMKYIAEVAQLVEHDLAKVGVAGSSPVFRSRSARMVEW